MFSQIRARFLQIQRSTAIISVLSVLSVLLIASIIPLILIWQSRSAESPKRTYGAILVDSPEVHTRERLVNDRFIQDAWLRQMLRDSDKPVFGVQGVTHRSEQRQLEVDSSVGINATSTKNKANDRSPGGKETGKASKPFVAQTSTPSPIHDFRDRFAYRNELRTRIIENQLDDRHDLKGNSLFRLKFDATIIPELNTRDYAKVSIRLTGPAEDNSEKNCNKENNKKNGPTYKALGDLSCDQIKRWKSLYIGWLNSVQVRLNQGFFTLRSAWEQERFPVDFYKEFIADIRRRYKLPPPSKRKKEESGKDPEHQNSQDLDSSSNKVNKNKHIHYRTIIQKLIDKVNLRDQGINLEAKLRPPDQILLKNTLDEFLQDKVLTLIFGDPSHNLQLDASWERTNIYKFASVKFYGEKTLVFEVSPPDERVITFSVLSKVPPKAAKQTNLQTIGEKNYTVHDGVDKTYVYVTVDEKTYRLKKKNTYRLKREDWTYLLKIRDTLEYVPDFPKAQKLHMFQKYKEFRETRKNQRSQSPELKEPKLSVPKEESLLNFLNKLQSQEDVYSYAVTPRESTQRIAQSRAAQDIEELTAALGTTFGEAQTKTLIRGLKNSSTSLSTIQRQAVIVGYGTAETTHGYGTAETTQKIAARFGWVIGPQEIVGSRGEADPSFRHQPSQNSLTALISLPSWWDHVTLTVTTSWTEDLKLIKSQSGVKSNETTTNQASKTEVDNKQASKNEEHNKYDVQLPVDYVALEGVLLGSVGIGPEVEEWRIKPIVLSLCHRASILIPGKRLWRSAVVTVGGQRANKIIVLPNMKGIIASFDVILPPNGMSLASGKNVQVPVNIWTSEGNITLANLAEIVVQESWKKQLQTVRKCPGEEQS